MGAPMARRILDAGHDLVVWNRSSEKALPLADHGASVAATPAEAAAGADVVITMLADASALEHVVFGDGGLAGAMTPGQVLVDMSTVGPDAVRSFAGRLPPGVQLVDAPVRGSVPEATDGSLVVLVGATDEAFDRVRAVLERLGTVQRVGGPGAGAAMKLVANSTLGATLAAFGEALALGDAFGIERDTLLDVLEDTPIGTTVKGKRRNVESGSFPPNFKLGLALKDMALVTDTAERMGRDLKVAAASRAWFERAASEDAADLDYSAVVATITRT